MASAALQWLPHVWPHPVHITSTAGSSSSSGSVPGPKTVLEPIRSKDIAASDCRKDGLEAILQEVVSSNLKEASKRHTNRLSSGYGVCLSGMELLIKGGDGELRSVPLLLTDVVGAALPRDHSADYVVVLAPRTAILSSSQSSTPSEPELQSAAQGSPQSQQDLWMFFLAGSPLEVKQFFFELGGRGALRWDLHECYILTQKSLGEGGAGQVFLGQSVLADSSGRNTDEGRGGALNVQQVAVKVLMKSQSYPKEALMRREIGFLSRVRGHPNITALYGVFCQTPEEREEDWDDDDEQREHQSEVRWFIAMELCSRGDLFDYIQGAGPLDDKGCVVIMICLFLALEHVHALGIVHRDVKPENILMGARSRAMLADFGIACDMDDTVEMTKMLGTPGYAAPEVVTGLKYDCLADVFSAGCVLYFGLCNKQAFHGDTLFDTLQLTAHCDPKYTKRRFGHVSSGVVSLMQFSLKKDPSSRPSAEQTLGALRAHVNKNLSKYSDSEVIAEWLGLDESPSSNSRLFSHESTRQSNSTTDATEASVLTPSHSNRARARLDAAEASPPAALTFNKNCMANVPEDARQHEEQEDVPADEVQSPVQPQSVVRSAAADTHEDAPDTPCNAPTSLTPRAPANPPPTSSVPKPPGAAARLHKKPEESDSHSEQQTSSGKLSDGSKPKQDQQTTNADKRHPGGIRSTLSSMPSKTWRTLTSAFRRKPAHTSERCLA
eukprot:TRINITY_DN10599_c0_g1_i2.p1 TRINITY_DN10599_c0_g1~~TRINITY_DN10599_c0_g1_i2.p1  ORF type:complete len:722 (+),score=105.12 TRINITY_DN10599_c0_g1_i2:41-2206(+)